MVAANVAALKKHRGISQEAMAEKAGVSQSTIGRVLAGTTAADLDTLRGLGFALGVEPWQLLIKGLHPDNLPVVRNIDPDEEALYDRLQKVTAELAALQRKRDT
jgi:transcriptional regulator with XRE-family HTH domain